MLELKLKHFVLIFDFSFFAVVSLMMLFSNNDYVVMCVLACLWHETGHLLAMMLTKVKVNKICFYGGGIKISPDKMFGFTPLSVKLEVFLAGSAMNLAMFIIFKNSQVEALHFFAVINAVLGAFNMLPFQFLDGGKIIVQIIRGISSYQRAVILERYLKWINAGMIILVMIAFSFVGKGNVSLFVTLCCLLLSALSDS